MGIRACYYITTLKNSGITGMLGFEPHNHGRCVDDALTSVRTICEQQGLNLTPVRRRVLELLLEQHRALGAYDILERLRAENFASQPPVAYRALDFLVEHGFAHRIESMNAFVACTHPGNHHSPTFLICRCCQRVNESCARPRQSWPASLARNSGFKLERTVVEAAGLCARCQQHDQPCADGRTA